jgi:uncharacterized protein (TIGR02172 family)
MQITTSTNDNAVTLGLDGRLDVDTIDALKSALNSVSAEQLVFDMRRCVFVSSIGIREILKAHRERSRAGGSIALVNVNRDVMDIFRITGMAEMIEIKPLAREISMDDLEFLSAGVCGKCYRVDRETVVKLYNDGIDASIAEREKEYAKAAFVLGIPTAISYDVVACGSQTGVVYEMLDAELFSVVIRADIENIPTHGRMLAAVAKAIHEVEPAPGVFPDIKERFRGYIREMDFFLSADDIAFLLRKLEEIPDAGTCVHFDIHSSNIMIRDGEPVIIDMGDLSTGSFLFDIGLLLTIYGIPELGISELATKIPNEKGVELWEAFRAAYFVDLDAATIAYIDANIAFLASLRVIYSITFLPALRDSLCSMMTDILLPRMSRD